MSTSGGSNRARMSSTPAVTSQTAMAESEALYPRLMAAVQVNLDPEHIGQNYQATADTSRAIASDVRGNAAAQALFGALSGRMTADGMQWPDNNSGMVLRMMSAMNQNMYSDRPAGGTEFSLVAALRLAAEAEFNVKGVRSPPSDLVQRARAVYGPHSDGLRAILRAMYTRTQSALKQAGVKNLVVYRAMSRGQERRPLSTLVAASLDAGATHGMYAMDGRDVYAIRVPASRVFSFLGTGFGDQADREVVLTGGDIGHWQAVPGMEGWE